MTKVGLVIDSTTVLKKQDIERYNIQIASLELNINGVAVKEIDTSDEYIVGLLDDKSIKIKTSAANPNDFLEIYNKLRNEGYQDIIVVPLSKGLSTTFNSANLAREMVSEKERIFVIDTDVCNFGNSNLVETIFPLMDEDRSVDEIVKSLEEKIKNTNLLFTIYDLKHLCNGGRLSVIGAFVGTILKIKPIIEVQNGKLEMIKKVRTNKNVIDVFMSHISVYANKFKHNFLKIVAIENNETCEILVKKVKDTWQNVMITIINKINPVFHTHLGKSGIGISISSCN